MAIARSGGSPFDVKCRGGSARHARREQRHGIMRHSPTNVAPAARHILPLALAMVISSTNVEAQERVQGPAPSFACRGAEASLTAAVEQAFELPRLRTLWQNH